MRESENPTSCVGEQAREGRKQHWKQYCDIFLRAVYKSL